MTMMELDNRGLAPPEPMVRILGALKELGTDGQLRVLMDREPFPLYAELERRGFEWTFETDSGENVLTIRRAGK